MATFKTNQIATCFKSDKFLPGQKCYMYYLATVIYFTGKSLSLYQKSKFYFLNVIWFLGFDFYSDILFTAIFLAAVN